MENTQPLSNVKIMFALREKMLLLNSSFPSLLNLIKIELMHLLNRVELMNKEWQ